MRRHESTKVQLWGCVALMNLALENAGNQIRIASEGGIAVVVIAMRRYGDNVLIQETGCAALCNLTLGCTAIQTKIVSEGGIVAVVTAMRQHGENVEVQKWGCGALRNLTPKSVDNRAKVVAAGGVDTVLSAMQRHEANPHIQEQGCWALKNFTLSNSPFSIECKSVVERAIELHNLGHIIDARTFRSPSRTRRKSRIGFRRPKNKRSNLGAAQTVDPDFFFRLNDLASPRSIAPPACDRR